MFLGFLSSSAPSHAQGAVTCPDEQFLAQYYTNQRLSKTPKFTRCEPQIDYTWGKSGPGSGVKTDLFSARWTGRFTFSAGNHLFTATADEGMRLWVDNALLIDSWTAKPPTTRQITVSLTAGLHLVRVEYYEKYGQAIAQVFWQPATPPPPPPSSPFVGTNLSVLADWSSEWPFVDAFKTSREWLTQCLSFQQSDCVSGWDTNEAHLLDLDEHGWVRSLPAPTDSPQFWFVGTLMFRGLNGHYPAGQYLVLYDGEGTLEYGFDARKDTIASKPGRDVLTVTPGNDGIYLKITATDPHHAGNYLRNIRVLMPGQEQTYQTQPFHPQFLQKIAPYSVLRFMNWMRANDTDQQQWQNRSLPADARYATTAGAPLELMLALANRTQADPWFTLPHQATDDYISQFALLTLHTLIPTRKVYVEYSNEVWNSQFSQGAWIEQQSQAAWPTSGESGFTKRLNWYGQRAAQICDIWKIAWGAESDRVHCVLSGQAANAWVISQALDCPLSSQAPCSAHGIDAIAMAPYFGYYLGASEFESAVQQWTMEEDGGLSRLFSEVMNGGVLPGGPSGGALQDTTRQIAAHAALAVTRNLQLLAYEGGQHLVGVGNVTNNPAITTLFVRANRDARMTTAYTQYLNIWKNLGGQLFVHFLNVDSYSKWGSWGALEYMDQSTSPRYEALINFIKANP